MITMMTEAEVHDEIAHIHVLLKNVQRQRRLLEHQQSQRGFDTPPHLITQIEDLHEKIIQYTTTLHQLQQRVVAHEYRRTVEEMEYRLLVAEAWAPPGTLLLSVLDQTRLEWAQVRLGIPSEQADAYACAVRTELAEEVLTQVASTNLQCVLTQLTQTPLGDHVLDTAPTILAAHHALAQQVGTAGEDYHQFFTDLQHLIRAMALDITATCIWVTRLLHVHDRPMTVPRLERALRLIAHQPNYRPYQHHVDVNITDLIRFYECPPAQCMELTE